MKKITYKTVSEEKETSGLYVGISFHEGDEQAPEKGLYGTLAIRDDKGNIVLNFELAPKDLKGFETEVGKLKERALKALNPKVEEIPDEPEEKES